MAPPEPGVRRRAGRLRGCVARLGLVVGGLFLTLCLVEVVFRTVCLEPKVPVDQAGFEQLISSRWPRPVSPTKPPGTVRILGLGDSFGEAGGADNFYYLVARELQDRGYPVEMVNLSVGEYDLPEEEALLARWGEQFQPDIVLHGFFVGNDFYLTGDGLLVTWRGISVRRRDLLHHPVPRSFESLVWLRYWLRGQIATRLHQTPGEAQPQPGTFAVSDYLRIEGDRMVHCLRQPPPDQRWSEVEALLRRIVEQSRRLGATYVMVMHPDEYQVEPELRAQVLAARGLNEADYDWDVPQRWLADFCRVQDVDAIDLLPAFRAAGSGGGLYRLRNSHYDQAGNELAARTIVEELIDRAPHLLRGGKGGPAWSG